MPVLLTCARAAALLSVGVRSCAEHPAVLFYRSLIRSDQATICLHYTVTVYKYCFEKIVLLKFYPILIEENESLNSLNESASEEEDEKGRLVKKSTASLSRLRRRDPINEMECCC